MRFTWMNKQNNKNLIVFFNGWGFDKKAAEKLNPEAFDVAEINDYRTFEPIKETFDNYEKKYLIAWSLGVYACNYYFDKFKNFDGFTAVNGTLKPVSDEFGIPVAAYNLTVENFNELTCKKFIKKIGAHCEITRDIDSLKQELISVRDLRINNYLPFNKAIISTKDRIFPYKNMSAFWKNIEVKEIEASHYIFDLYKSWSDLI